MPACICLIHHSAALLFSGSFEAHSLSRLVPGVPAVCVWYMCVCVCEWEVYSKKKKKNKGGVNRSPVRVDNADKPFNGRA